VALASALLPANGRVIGLRGEKKWQSIDPVIDPMTSLISMSRLAQSAQVFKPHLIVACASGYPRNISYAGFRKIADDSGAILMADLAQTAPLVAAGVSPSPFEHCDIVIATAQRAMAAFRSDLVFYRKGQFGESSRTGFL
jgi:glycine hydroxymethyltransferase